MIKDLRLKIKASFIINHQPVISLERGFLRLTKKTHQKTALRAVLVNLSGMLNDWTDNLEKNIPQKSGVVKSENMSVDLPGVEPGRLGLSVQSSKPAKPTPVLFYHNDWQSGFIKLTKKSLMTIFIVWFVLIGSGLFVLFNPFVPKASAAWFNDNWAYRQGEK